MKFLRSVSRVFGASPMAAIASVNVGVPASTYKKYRQRPRFLLAPRGAAWGGAHGLLEEFIG